MRDVCAGYLPPEWLSPELLAGLATVSLVLLTIGVLGVPWLITRLPADHFVRERPPSVRHPVLRVLIRVAKNALGLLLLLAGIAMLVLPGQGLLTMLAALMLLDFPGKRRLQRRWVSTPPLRRAIDAIRRRAGKPPIEL